jgi:hypothetical protein
LKIGNKAAQDMAPKNQKKLKKNNF